MFDFGTTSTLGRLEKRGEDFNTEDRNIERDYKLHIGAIGLAKNFFAKE